MANPNTRLVSRLAGLIRRDLLKEPGLWGIGATSWVLLYTCCRAEPLTAQEVALLVELVDRYMAEVNLPVRPWCRPPGLDSAGNMPT